MKDFYKQLHEVFTKPETKQQYTSQNIPPIKYIDLYAGQDLNPENFDVMPFPALLIAWEISYAQNTATATITVRLAYEQLRSTSNITPDDTKNNALNFLDFVALTDKILKTIETPQTGALSLVSESFTIEPTIVDVYTLVYTCSYNGNHEHKIKKYINGHVDNLKLDGRVRI